MMVHDGKKERYALPGSKLHLFGILFGIAIYIVSIKLKQPSAGIFLGFLSWFIISRWTYKIMERKTLQYIKSLEDEGDITKLLDYTTFAADRLINSAKIIDYRQELIRKIEESPATVETCTAMNGDAGINIQTDVLSPTEETADTIIERNETVESVLSRFSVVILSLMPFVFFPFIRQTFPHIGLWFPTIILIFSLYLCFDPQKPWDKTISKAGLIVAVFAFGLFGLTLLFGDISAPDPQWNLDMKPVSPSWPVKILQFSVFLFSVVIHECAHGLCAYFVGDSTAKSLGRISLNPIRHIDLFGSIILPVLMMLVPGGVVFGWAKPVPVNPQNYRRPRRGNFVVSVAGVASNLLLALFFTSMLMTLGVVLHSLYPQMWTEGLMIPWRQVVIHGVPYRFLWVCLIELFKAGIYMNMVLFSLNILPVPPLDGFGILESMMPKAIQGLMTKLRGIGSWAFLALVMFNIIDYLLIPGIFMAMFLLAGAGFAAKLG